MGFLEASRHKQRLSKLRKQLDSEPSPLGYAELARGYLSIGDRENAIAALNAGDRLFRGADVLQRVRAAVDGDVDDRLARAKDALRATGSVAAHLDLVDAYRAAGRVEPMRSTLRDALEKFPNDSMVLTRMGDMRYRSFLETHAGPDCNAAIECLERAIASESSNLRARYVLAELLYRLGAVEACGKALDELLVLTPDHVHATDLKRALTRSRPASESEAPREELWSILAQIEETQRLPNPRLPWESEQAQRDRDTNGARPEIELERVRQSTLAMRAIYLAQNGETHARGADDGFADIVRRLKDVSAKAAGGMELGAPLHLSIEAEQGTLLVETKRTAAVALVAPPRAPLRALTESARDSLEKLTRG